MSYFVQSGHHFSHLEIQHLDHSHKILMQLIWANLKKIHIPVKEVQLK